MRKLLIIFICLLPLVAEGQTNYYVSNTGSDAAAGTSEGTAWQTLGKVQAELSTMTSSDSILLNRGDIFREVLDFGERDYTSAMLNIGAYGTGAKPQVRGSKILGTFTQLNDTVWYVEDSDLPSDDYYIGALTIGDKFYKSARMPESGYYNITSAPSGNDTIIDDNLTITGLTGASTLIRTITWSMERRVVTAQNGTTLTLNEDTHYSLETGEGYILANHYNLLNENGDWAYDTISGRLFIYWDANINTETIEVAIYDTIFDLSRSENISISNIDFSFANSEILYTFLSEEVINVDSCDFRYAPFATYERTIYEANKNFLNCSLDSLWNGAIVGDGYSGTIYNNDITNIFTVPSMRWWPRINQTFQYYDSKDTVIVRKNRISNVGYNGITFNDNKVTIVDSNYIENFNMITGDGGAIYSFKNDSTAFIRNNIIKGGYNNTEGLASSEPLESPSVGIYLDENSDDITVTGNTVDSSYFGLQLHDVSTDYVYGNTFYDSYKTGLYVSNDALGGYTRNNIFYSENSVIYPNVGTSFLSFREITTGTMDIDSNYYINKYVNQDSLVYSFDLGGSGRELLSFTEWQSNIFSWDDNSNDSIDGYLVDTNTIADLLYNVTDTNQTYYFESGYTYFDVESATYTTSTIIEPFQSELLFINGITPKSSYVEPSLVAPSASDTITIDSIKINVTINYEPYQWINLAGNVEASYDTIDIEIFNRSGRAADAITPITNWPDSVSIGYGYANSGYLTIMVTNVSSSYLYDVDVLINDDASTGTYNEYAKVQTDSLLINARDKANNTASFTNMVTDNDTLIISTRGITSTTAHLNGVKIYVKEVPCDTANMIVTAETTPTPNGSITTTTIGGKTPYTYDWSPGGETTKDLTGLDTGIYSVIVTDDNGCTGNGSWTIRPRGIVKFSTGLWIYNGGSVVFE